MKRPKKIKKNREYYIKEILEGQTVLDSFFTEWIFLTQQDLNGFSFNELRQAFSELKDELKIANDNYEADYTNHGRSE